ncbi:MAG: nucleotidyltransferase domain-containing protein [Methylobacter sp.]|uniref:nucleotidyltransferase family protein n=1 Tax=Methylobacter sp. TaxID=2051955 RepID=UPI002731C637|nr:nucleotidyltransferase domain-containing protein [Methylobacter sp.]MDP1666711.1 nucleotidyltransferase domain-containing protein [Methylobacter sp.]
MHPFIQQHQSAIAELCRRYHVQRLEVFGSAARGTDFAPDRSDADFLVVFSPSADSPTLKVFFGLQADLSQILGRAVDLAETSALRNPYVQASVNQSCEVVYAA